MSGIAGEAEVQGLRLKRRSLVTFTSRNRQAPRDEKGDRSTGPSTQMRTSNFTFPTMEPLLIVRMELRK